MCGICGIYEEDNSVIEADVLSAMTNIMAHRGPDDEGYYQKGPIGLGHRRLSIIDLSGGHQPIASEDGRIRLVCNGEIYNHQSLRKELEQKGHRFRTHSDSEVIVHLYEECGEKLLSRLYGMFAFALWDEGEKRLLLGRDRLGQKPLYYSRRNATFLFASEIKSILRHPKAQAAPNLSAIHDFLSYQYVPAPRTAFQGIFKLPAASYLLLDKSGLRIERYWHLAFPAGRPKLAEEEYCLRLRELLREAVRIRLMSDVPLGAFLSGGIDSSAVVALMSELCDQPVKTFSIGFSEEKFNELGFARQISRRFATEHREFTVRPDAMEILPKLIWHYNEPFADPSALPTYYVSRMSRQYVTVALCGDAGDENFAGYERYLMHKWALLYQKIPASLRRHVMGKMTEGLARAFPGTSFFRRLHNFTGNLSLPTAPLHNRLMTYFTPELARELYTPQLAQANDNSYLLRLFAQTDDWDYLDKVLWVDIHSYLPDDLLVKVDVASMSNSLEVRSPFLDHRVVELAASIPGALKLRGLTRLKYILKRAFADILPPAIIERKKMGFSVPLSHWFRGDLKEYLHQVLLDESSRKRGYFLPGAVEQLLKEHCRGEQDHGFKLWNLLILELWFRAFIDQKGESAP